MTGLQAETVERRTKLLQVLRLPGTAWRNCHTVARLQQLFDDDYPGPAGRRKLQRDLKELIDSELVEACPMNAGTWHYRRVEDALNEDLLIRRQAADSLMALIADALETGTLAEVWHRVLSDTDVGLLSRAQLLVIPDHLQLQQVRLSSEILCEVVRALIDSYPIKAHYQKRNGELGQGTLHPHAIIHRGPIPYLLAVKEDALDTIKHFPLHRMNSVQALTGEDFHHLSGFDLQRYIDRGHGDFGRGDEIRLALRARGYIAEILEACPLTAEQLMVLEPSSSSFEVHVEATLPSTGSLLRWLLAAGSNIEVLAPRELRERVARQLDHASTYYEDAL